MLGPSSSELLNKEKGERKEDLTFLIISFILPYLERQGRAKGGKLQSSQVGSQNCSAPLLCPIQHSRIFLCLLCGQRKKEQMRKSGKLLFGYTSKRSFLIDNGIL